MQMEAKSFQNYLHFFPPKGDTIGIELVVQK